MQDSGTVHARRRGLSLSLKLVLLAVLAVVCVFAVKYGRRCAVLDNFGVVVQGQIYRSGQPLPWQIERLIRERRLRTVLNTREPEAAAWLMRTEQKVCDRHGVRMVRIMMPGDGRGTYAQYDEALAILRTPTNLPALVHCARGAYRSGAVVAAYRVLVQGRSEDEAVREMRDYRARTRDHVLVPYLREYFRSRREGEEHGSAETAAGKAGE